MIPQLTAEEITRRVREIDAEVTISYDPTLGWRWQRPCPKHGCDAIAPHTQGQLLGHTYDVATARLLKLYGHAGINLQSQSPQGETGRKNYQAERWHEAVGIVSDIIALGIYRNYLTHAQAVDLLDLQKQLRHLVSHYERDERQSR